MPVTVSSSSLILLEINCTYAALLLGEGPALPLGDLITLAPGHIRALLPLHSLTLPLTDLLTLFPWHIPALLLGLLRALLLSKVALGADLGVDSLTLLGIHSVAFFLGIDGFTLTLRNILNKGNISD